MEMVYLMLILVCFGDLWVNKVSISHLQQLDLKNKIKSQQSYNYTDSLGINGLTRFIAKPSSPISTALFLQHPPGDQDPAAGRVHVLFRVPPLLALVEGPLHGLPQGHALQLQLAVHRLSGRHDGWVVGGDDDGLSTKNSKLWSLPTPSLSALARASMDRCLKGCTIYKAKRLPSVVDLSIGGWQSQQQRVTAT